MVIYCQYFSICYIGQTMKITKLEKSRVEIVGSIPVDEFAKFRHKALENINNEVTIDGFRKGKVPENILMQKVGDMAILEEMAELALSKIYPEIIIKRHRPTGNKYYKAGKRQPFGI